MRRLLPASFLVLLFSSVMTWLVVPQTMWDQTIRQIVASTLYVQNWALAADALSIRRPATHPPSSSTIGRCRSKNSSTWCGRCWL